MYGVQGQRVVVEWPVDRALKGRRATLLSNRNARGYHRAQVDGGQTKRLHSCEIRPLMECDL